MQAQIPEQIAYLTGALRESAQYPVPIVPQFEGLNFWYLPPDGDSPAALLAFAHQTVPGIEGGTTGEFVALSQALPRHHAPRAIRYAPRFVETPTGKIDRGATLAATAAPES